MTEADPPPQSPNSGPAVPVDTAPPRSADLACERQSPGNADQYAIDEQMDAIDENVGVSYSHSSDHQAKAEAGVVDVSMGLYAGDDNFVEKVITSPAEDNAARCDSQQEPQAPPASGPSAEAVAAAQPLQERAKEHSGQLPTTIPSEEAQNTPIPDEQKRTYSVGVNIVADGAAAAAASQQYSYTYQVLERAASGIDPNSFQHATPAPPADSSQDAAIFAAQQHSYVPASVLVAAGSVQNSPQLGVHQHPYNQEMPLPAPVDRAGGNKAQGPQSHAYQPLAQMPATSAPQVLSQEGGPFGATPVAQPHTYGDHTYQDLQTSAPADSLGIQQHSTLGSRVGSAGVQDTSTLGTQQPVYDQQAHLSHMQTADNGGGQNTHLHAYQQHSHIPPPTDTSSALAVHTNEYGQHMPMPASAPGDAGAVQDSVPRSIQEPTYEYHAHVPTAMVSDAPPGPDPATYCATSNPYEYTHQQHSVMPISGDSGGLQEAMQKHGYHPQSQLTTSYKYVAATASLPMSSESLYSATDNVGAISQQSQGIAADAGCSTQGYVSFHAPTSESTKPVASHHMAPQAVSHMYMHYQPGEAGATSSHLEVQQHYSGSAAYAVTDAAIASDGGGPPARSRWKPNNGQKNVLEAHFNAGYTKASEALHVQVVAAGPATMRQIAVWLKNRAARSKPLKKQARKLGEKGEGQTDGKVKPTKSKRQNTKHSPDAPPPITVKRLHQMAASGVEELHKCLMTVDSDQCIEIASDIRAAKQIFCYGVGREGLAMRSWVTRLQQLGVKAFFVGDQVCPPLQSGDLLVVSAGPTHYATVAAICEQSRKQGGRVVAFTAHATAPLSFADSILRIPSICSGAPEDRHDPDKLAGNSKRSVFLLGGQYELALQVTLDCMASMVFEDSGLTRKELCSRVPNIC